MIRTKSDLRHYLEQDRIQLNKARKRPRIIGDEVWVYQILLRMEEYYYNTGRGMMFQYFRIRRYRLGLKLGFTIGKNVCGPGLSLAHHGTIIINKRARIGANARIHAGVNIGTKAGESGVAPIIGSNVYIGPGAKIFGGIVIGDNVAIGANAVVNKSFPDGNITIGGIPARPISTKNSKDLWLKEYEKKSLE
jgi:serine O-acetyltransferase